MESPRREWLKYLREGDVVCDCSFRHMVIKEIYELKVPNVPSWLRNIIFHDAVPFFLCNVLWDATTYVFNRFGWTVLVDKDLIFWDGSSCSAEHCCDPVNDHDESDHPK